MFRVIFPWSQIGSTSECLCSFLFTHGFFLILHFLSFCVVVLGSVMILVFNILWFNSCRRIFLNIFYTTYLTTNISRLDNQPFLSSFSYSRLVVLDLSDFDQISIILFLYYLYVGLLLR